MANTLKTQIDNMIGAQLASTLYDDWLVAGARTIVDILKPEDLERHSTSVAVPITTGLSVTLYRIWRILVSGYDAMQFPTGYETQIVDTNSLLRSSPFTPGYIISAGTLKCYNGSNVAGTLIGIAYPSAIDSSVATDIDGVPENLHHAVILYAAIQGRIKQLSDLMLTTLTALSIADIDTSTITAPTSPTLASVSYTDATAASVSATTIGTIPSAPSYTNVTVPTGIATVLALFDTAVTFDTLSATSISDLTLVATAPSMPAGFATALTAFDSAMTAEDIELATTQLAKAGEYAKQYLEDINLYNQKVQAEVSVYQANTGKTLEVQKTKVTINTLLPKNFLDKANVYISLYANQIQESLGSFNKDLKKFDADVQKVISQAQTTLQEALENAKLSTDVSVQNKAKTMEAIVQNNNSLLQKYQGDVGNYAQKVNTLVSQYTTNLQIFQAKVARTMNEHNGLLAGLNQLQSEYHGLVSLYLGRIPGDAQQPQG